MTRKLRKPIAQEHPMGCGLACVAYLTNKSYKHIFKNANNPPQAYGRGYFCSELIRELDKYGMSYEWFSVKQKKIDRYSLDDIKNNSIVFVGRDKNLYLNGHFFVKVSKNLYMNPWKNFPTITPAMAGLQRGLPGQVTHVISPI